MIHFREDELGVTFKVKVKPKAKRNAVMGARADAVLVSVTAAPEKGKANGAVIAVLSKHLKISKSSIEIVVGESSPEKVVRVKGLSIASVEEALLPSVSNPD